MARMVATSLVKVEIAFFFNDVWCHLGTPSGRNKDCKHLSKNVWRGKLAPTG